MNFKIKPYYKNFTLICKHKWFVLIAGIKLKAPILSLIIHDWSKLSPAEFPHYSEQFFGQQSNPSGFARAWNHHQKANPHHWEYWVMESGHFRGGYPDGTVLQMPQNFAREMVADWFAAHRAYEGYWPKDLENWEWMEKNFEKIKLHGETRQFVKNLLKQYFLK